MRTRLRNVLVALVVLGICVPAEGLLSRTSTMDPTLTWNCRDPNDAEKSEMLANGNSKFQQTRDGDPLGIAGGCMPDATCKDGKSAWTNVFG